MKKKKKKEKKSKSDPVNYLIIILTCLCLRVRNPFTILIWWPSLTTCSPRLWLLRRQIGSWRQCIWQRRIWNTCFSLSRIVPRWINIAKYICFTRTKLYRGIRYWDAWRYFVWGSYVFWSNSLLWRSISRNINDSTTGVRIWVSSFPDSDTVVIYLAFLLLRPCTFLSEGKKSIISEPRGMQESGKSTFLCKILISLSPDSFWTLKTGIFSKGF